MNDSQLRHEGMKVLTERLGAANAEKFIAILASEPADIEERYMSCKNDDLWAEIMHISNGFRVRNFEMH
jgi:nitrogen fixation protein